MATDKRARKKANRSARIQAQEAQAKRKRLIKVGIRVGVLLAISLGILYLGSLGRSGPEPTTTSAPPSSIWRSFASLDPACGGEIPENGPSGEQFTAPTDLGLEDPVTAEIVTNCGTLTVDLDPALAPESVNAFVFLAEAGYYDRTAVHRLAPGFVVQGGDPTASGTGGPGFTIPDEFPPVGTPYPRGSVALAHSSQADSSGSQFFIVLTDDGAGHLGSAENLLFNRLGTLVDGFDTLDTIAALPVSGNDTPAVGLFIETVTITR